MRKTDVFARALDLYVEKLENISKDEEIHAGEIMKSDIDKTIEHTKYVKTHIIDIVKDDHIFPDEIDYRKIMSDALSCYIKHVETILRVISVDLGATPEFKNSQEDLELAKNGLKSFQD